MSCKLGNLTILFFYKCLNMYCLIFLPRQSVTYETMVYKTGKKFGEKMAKHVDKILQLIC